MPCTLQVNCATAASGGSIPIGNAVYEWNDGGLQTLGPVNGVTTITLYHGTSTNMKASATGFNPLSQSVVCGGGVNGLYLFQLTEVGSGGGGPPSSSGGCFIVTAAYGTESAPEVELLQRFRDSVIRRTRWGSKLFDDLSKYYYRVSPAIAKEMIRDPGLRRVLTFAIVEPWVNYMKLMMGRPDLKGMNLDGLDPKLRTFLLQLQSDGDKWIKRIELPKSFKGRDPVESIDELNVVLGMVLLRTNGRAYLDDLERHGELPLQYPKKEETKLRRALTEAGRTEDEVASILYGTNRP